MQSNNRHRNKTNTVEAAGIVIYRLKEDNTCEYLMVQNKHDGGWTPPKGHLHRTNESAMNAAKRETHEEVGLKEETGYRMHQSEPIYSCSYYDKKRHRNKVSTYFLAEYVPDAEIRLQKRELQKFAWLSAQEAVERMGYDEMTELIEHAEREIAKKGVLPPLPPSPSSSSFSSSSSSTTVEVKVGVD